MFEIVEGIHKAFRIESTWAFVLLIALGTGGIGGFVAWIIDQGYRNSPEYRQSHPTSPKVLGATTVDLLVAPAPVPASAVPIKKSRRTHKTALVPKGTASPLPRIGSNNTLVNPSSIPSMGDGNTIVGPTDISGNTIINKGGTAIGSGACAGPTGTAIGAGAKAGSCSDSTQPSPKQ